MATESRAKPGPGPGGLIRARRALKGLTIAELAARAGVSKSTISKVEIGVRPGLGSAAAVRVAPVLGVTPGALRSPGASAGPHPDPPEVIPEVSEPAPSAWPFAPSSHLMTMARMVAAARDVDVDDYLIAILRPAVVADLAATVKRLGGSR